MRSYVEPYPLCDTILKLLAETQGRRRTESDISGTYKGNTDVRSAMGQLVKDGYVVPDPPGSGYYLILASGSAFISDGGYKQEFERQQLAEELQTRVHLASIAVAQSVKDTNEATLTYNKKTNRIMNLTLLVAAVSAMGTVGGVFGTCNSNRQPTVRNTISAAPKPAAPIGVIKKDTMQVRAPKDTIKTK